MVWFGKAINMASLVVSYAQGVAALADKIIEGISIAIGLVIFLLLLEYGPIPADYLWHILLHVD